MSKKYNTVFENYSKKYPAEWLKVNKKKADLVRQIFLDYQLNQETYNKLASEFTLIKNELKNKNGFTWSDFVNVITKSIPNFKPEEFLRYGYSFKNREDMHKVRLRFDSVNYRVENKSTIFSNVVLF